MYLYFVINGGDDYDNRWTAIDDVVSTGVQRPASRGTAEGLSLSEEISGGWEAKLRI